MISAGEFIIIQNKSVDTQSYVSEFPGELVYEPTQ